jgi:hypothetical protein
MRRSFALASRARTTRALTAVALASITVASAGCRSWQPSPIERVSPATLANAKAVRVTRLDGSTLEIAGPQLAGDSLVGSVGSPPQRAAVALRDVQRLEERRVDAGRTGGLTAAILLGALAVVGIIAAVALASLSAY